MAAPPTGITDPRQLAVDEVVTTWPDVRAKQVFGHRGWVRGGKMFGFLASGGAAVRLTPSMDSAAIMARDGVEQFAYNGRPMKGWVVLPLERDAELDAAIDLERQAYETVGT
jgi:hypothetical protein